MSLKSVFPIIFLVGSAPLAREAAAGDSAGDSGQRHGGEGGLFFCLSAFGSETSSNENCFGR